MRWYAKKAIRVTREDGTIYIAERGQHVPEASNWKKPKIWCFSMPNEVIAEEKEEEYIDEESIDLPVEKEPKESINYEEMGLKDLRKLTLSITKITGEDEINPNKMNKKELVAYLQSRNV